MSIHSLKRWTGRGIIPGLLFVSRSGHRKTGADVVPLRFVFGLSCGRCEPFRLLEVFYIPRLRRAQRAEKRPLRAHNEAYSKNGLLFAWELVIIKFGGGGNAPRRGRSSATIRAAAPSSHFLYLVFLTPFKSRMIPPGLSLICFIAPRMAFSTALTVVGPFSSHAFPRQRKSCVFSFRLSASVRSLIPLPKVFCSRWPFRFRGCVPPSCNSLGK